MNTALDHMESTSALYPLVSVIKNSESELGADRVWKTENAEQEHFMRLYAVTKDDLSKIPELVSKVSYNNETINTFLAERGFDIKLDPFMDDSFGVAAAMKIAMQWVAEGNKSNMTVGGTRYTSACVEEGVQVYKTDNDTVVVLDTKSGDKVYLQVCSPPTDLHEAGCALLSKRLLPCYDYTGVVFPQIEVDHQPDISWLLKMNTTNEAGRYAEIGQAKQQTKFKMDEKGAVVESAAAIEVQLECCTIGRPPYMVNAPFLVAVCRPGLKMPLFTGYMDKDAWVKN